MFKIHWVHQVTLSTLACNIYLLNFLLSTQGGHVMLRSAQPYVYFIFVQILCIHFHLNFYKINPFQHLQRKNCLSLSTIRSCNFVVSGILVPYMKSDNRQGFASLTVNNELIDYFKGFLNYIWVQIYFYALRTIVWVHIVFQFEHSFLLDRSSRCSL